MIHISQPATGLEEWEALRDPLLSGWLSQGPQVAEFERAFARRHDVQHALATSSCTTALHLILVALGVGPGDEIIVPAFTWVATANVALYCGATPVLVDVDRQAFNLDAAQVAAKVSPRTKAIIAVHLFGLCADVDAIRAAAPGIPIIEDAACAAGATYRGRSAGTLGVAAAFSFHPRKSITTGEGGMITTSDPVLAERMNQLRNHGASVSEEQRHAGPKPYLLPDFNLLGFNYRMTDLQGAVGRVQLSKLDRFLAERQHWADYYRQELAGLHWLRTPTVPEGDRHAWQAYVCDVDEMIHRNQLMEKLQMAGIQTRPGTHAVHLLGHYRQRFRFQPDDFPAARDCDRRTLALPLHNRMTAADYEHVARTLRHIS